MRKSYAIRRVVAYAQGQIEFGRLAAEPTFRDFVCLYMAEGYTRSRNTVSVCNSDPAIVVLSARWVCRFARNPLKCSVQYHADQALDDLQRFWAERLFVAPEEIRLVPKSNSGRLSG
jgi:hypothetical protein